MRIRLTVTTAHEECDVVVDAAAGTDVTRLRRAMAEAVGVPPDVAWWSGRRLLPDTALLGGPGLRTGDEVSIGSPGSAEAERSPLHLAVVGGPGSGAVLPLGRGVHLLGRGEMCDLRLPDAEVSRRHAAVTVTTAGVTVRDLDSRNGTTRSGDVIDRDGGDLEPDDALRVGHSTVVLRSGLAVPAAVRPTDDGRVLVLRPGDERATAVAPTLTSPTPPRDRNRPRTAWIAALVPAVAAAGLAWFLHTWQFLAFAALSPLTVLGTAAGDRWNWRASRRRAAADHARTAGEFARRRSVVLLEERAARTAAHPDPPRCLQAAEGPAAPLWRRRAADPGALHVRVGLASRPSRSLAVGSDGATRPLGELADVPLCADLTRGPLGIAGPRDHSLAVARAAVVQLAVAHPPGAIEFALLIPDDEVGGDWDWLRWLPHRVRRAADPDARSALLSELLDRIEAVPTRWGGGHPPAPTPWTVVVVDRPGATAEHQTLGQVLERGAAAGVHAVCVDRTAQGLPAACAALAVSDGATHALLAVGGSAWDTADGGSDALGPVVADQVTSSWCVRLARALAPLDDGARDDALPRRVRLRDLLDLASDDAVVAAWERCAPPGSTSPLRATVGVDAQGPLVLDLDADGPHALVAGTTGAGKSEFLRTWIAAVAAAHPPDDTGFLLVDYKGGAAFGACTRLPHTLGLVTDLDPHLTGRVLRSLDAEIRRRERLFAAVGASDLAGYRRRGGAEPVPRLLVVVDEFATLAADLPDFVPGLVDVAQRGRSLGLHLVLATQRPGHVVSPAIRANTSLRIALRVTDPGESDDVVGTPDAAVLDPSCPGRAVVRTARGLAPVQFARISAPTGVDHSAVRVDRVGPWEEPPARPRPDTERTDLDDLVELLDKAWARRSADGAASPRPTWLPPLPDQLVRSELTHSSDPADGRSRVVLGLRDRPDHQSQVTEHLDLDAGGTLLVVGAARTGRTELLRAVAHASAERGVPTAVIDSGGLDTLAALPNTVARVAASDTDSVLRLLDLLERECAARREATARPPLLVLVDTWNAVASALDDLDAGRATERLLALCRTAGALGVTVVVTGDRTALAARTASAADRVLVLRLADPADVAMAGLTPRDVPDHMPPGRAISCPDGELLQLARAGAVPIGTVPDRTLTGLRLRTLPTRYALPPGTGPGARGVHLGVGGDTAGRVEVDLWAAGGRWLVAGPPRSGRSSALGVIASEAAAAGVEVSWWARAHSPLAGLANAHGWAMLPPETRELGDLGGPRQLIVLDDVDDLADAALSEAVAVALRAAPPHTLAVVCSGRPDELLMSYRGVVAEVRRARRGVLLRPGPGDGDLVGVRTGRAAAAAPPGRGLLVSDGVHLDGAAVPVTPLAVQVAALADPVGST